MKSIQFFGAFSLFFLPWPAGQAERGKKTPHISRNHSETFFASGKRKLLCGISNHVQTTRIAGKKTRGIKCVCFHWRSVCSIAQQCGLRRCNYMKKYRLLIVVFSTICIAASNAIETMTKRWCSWKWFANRQSAFLWELWVSGFRTQDSANIFCAICYSNANELNLFEQKCSKSFKIKCPPKPSSQQHTWIRSAQSVCSWQQCHWINCSKSFWLSIKLQRIFHNPFSIHPFFFPRVRRM